MLPENDLSESAVLERARTVARSAIAPRANAVDDSDRVPHDNLRALAGAGLLSLAVPKDYSGAGLPPHVLRRFHGILAEACGTTAFVAIQHATACSLIARSQSDALRSRLLPQMARGDLLGAPAFSHLRRPGPPAVQVTEDGEDYLFDGVAPWVTGWGGIGTVALGGTLSDGRFLYAALVIDETPGIQAWPPMRLAAMNASSTVSITLSRARASKDRLLFIQTPEEARSADAAGMLNQAPCSLGVAAAAATLLELRTRHDPSLMPFAQALRDEIERCWHDVELWAEKPHDTAFPENALAVRAHCVDLGVRAALAAIVATGGTALKRDKDAQRLYREAMLYAVAPQTSALRRATLTRLLLGH